MKDRERIRLLEFAPEPVGAIGGMPDGYERIYQRVKRMFLVEVFSEDHAKQLIEWVRNTARFEYSQDLDTGKYYIRISVRVPVQADDPRCHDRIEKFELGE